MKNSSSQPGNRYPKSPSTQAWEPTDVNAADPTSGEMHSPFAECAGKYSNTKAGLEEGPGIPVPKGGTGRTFSSEELTNENFKQGEMPVTDINYFSFEKR